ncbi:hypothetical protein F5Y17DRAFT_33322 [Xylariaceae sp. FL0594]|nr:hypothetical protein F5Y17DRAFT_33322 [Xylariaceae sp. FL0594]
MLHHTEQHVLRRFSSSSSTFSFTAVVFLALLLSVYWPWTYWLSVHVCVVAGLYYRVPFPQYTLRHEGIAVDVIVVVGFQILPSLSTRLGKPAQCKFNCAPQISAPCSLPHALESLLGIVQSLSKSRCGWVEQGA